MEETLGKRISSHRKALGLTQDALAEQLGITAQAVSKWENDQSCPDITILPKLAEIFNCTTDKLLGVASPKKQPEEFPPELVEAKPLPETSPTRPAVQWHALKSPGAAFGFWLFLTGLVFCITKMRNMLCGIEDIAIACAVFAFGLHGFFRRFSLLRLCCAAAGGFFVLNLLLDTSVAGIDWTVPLGAAIALFGLDLLLDALLGRKHIISKGHFSSDSIKNNCIFDNSRFECTTSFGEDHHLITTPLLSGGKADLRFGNLTIDLRSCEAIAENCTLEITSAFGELELVVPGRFQAEANIHTAFAAFETIGCANSDFHNTIYVNGSASFGHICIRYV